MLYSIFAFVLWQKYFLSFVNVDYDDSDDNNNSNDELLLRNCSVKKEC